jgi:hypothetical protein
VRAVRSRAHVHVQQQAGDVQPQQSVHPQQGHAGSQLTPQ